MSLPEIDWHSLTDDELAHLIRRAEAEERRRWEASRSPSVVDDLRAAIGIPRIVHPNTVPSKKGTIRVQVITKPSTDPAFKAQHIVVKSLKKREP